MRPCQPLCTDFRTVTLVWRFKVRIICAASMLTSEPKPHQINRFSSVLSIPKFENVAPQNDANFGIGTLAGLLLGKTSLDSVYGLR
jgi:hypothetical protein